MPTFPSLAWAEAFRSALNARADYAEAAKAWEGDILLLVTPDGEDPTGQGIHLDLVHGSCRSATFVPDPSIVSSEFVFVGSRPDWNRLLKGEIDPVTSLLNGTFKIRGNLAKVMRFTRAATLLTQTAATIPDGA